MAAVVYILCMFLSFMCFVLLYKGYQQNKFRLLFWSAWGFLGFALNNLLLFIDLIVIPNGADLSLVRTVPALIGMSTLVYGLVTEQT